VSETIDPLAGSYYLEHLTNEMERGFERYRDEIDGMGGMVAAVERGYPQREIVEASFHFQQQVEEKEKVIVGINKYVATEDGAKIPVLAIDPDVERKQIARTLNTRAERDAGRWREAMDRLRAAAQAHAELMPAFVECARAMATVGEQVQVLKETYGEYHDPGYF
jgi:methylmalonyl-CoA mutase N-terminal domain/subunit